MKVVCGAYYVHKSNLNELFNKVNDPELEALIQQTDVDYDVVKYDKGNVTLIKASDWDTANEPLIDYTVLFKAGSLSEPGVKRINGRQIYHNKWMFVSPDYTGFNVDEARKRTEIWNSIPDIKSHKNRIGNKTYWINLLKQYDIPV